MEYLIRKQLNQYYTFTHISFLLIGLTYTLNSQLRSGHQSNKNSTRQIFVYKKTEPTNAIAIAPHQPTYLHIGQIKHCLVHYITCLQDPTVCGSCKLLSKWHYRRLTGRKVSADDILQNLFCQVKTFIYKNEPR
jgi:hypothetical protein